MICRPLTVSKWCSAVPVFRPEAALPTIYVTVWTAARELNDHSKLPTRQAAFGEIDLFPSDAIVIEIDSYGSKCGCTGFAFTPDDHINSRAFRQHLAPVIPGIDAAIDNSDLGQGSFDLLNQNDNGGAG